MADSILAGLLGADLERALVNDERFGVAYEALSPLARGALKTGIQHLFEIFHDHRRGEARVGARFAGGFAVSRLTRPLDLVLVVSPGPLAAPARLLAAALPALLASVGLVAAVSLDGPFSNPALAALELAGLETALETIPETLFALPLALVQANAKAAVLLLSPDETPPELIAAFVRCPNITLWAAPAVSLALLASPRTHWDYAALALAHGQTRIAVYSEPDQDLPEQCARACGGLEELLASAPLAAYLPDSAQRRALGRAPLILGPGRESCFIWPDLTPGFFFDHSLAVGRRTAL